MQGCLQLRCENLHRGRALGNEHLFLPFDDDPTLSVILSKAFLLARDTKITDRSIVAQIRTG